MPRTGFGFYIGPHGYRKIVLGVMCFGRMWVITLWRW